MEELKEDGEMLSIGCLNDNCILACYDDFFIHKMSVRIYRYCFADPAGRRSGGSSLLKHSKGFGGGWVVITFAWGFAVMCGHLWPLLLGSSPESALSIGLALAHTFPGLMYLLYYSAIGRGFLELFWSMFSIKIITMQQKIRCEIRYFLYDAAIRISP